MNIRILYAPIPEPTTMVVAAAPEPCPTIKAARRSKNEALRLELLRLRPGEMLPHYVPAYWMAHRAAQMLGITIRTRKDCLGVRVWRVA